MANYGKPEYWDDRYTKDKEQFDWYQRYSGLKEIINTHISQPQSQYDHDGRNKVLNIGAGNSRKFFHKPLTK